MKGKKIIFLGMIVLLLTGCMHQKEKMEDYLKENKYEYKDKCYRKNRKKKDTTEIIKFCLEECKVYASDTAMEDYFVLDLKTRNMQYIYSYITYQTDLSRQEDVCLFQGEEIDLNSSYCENAAKAFEKQLNIIEEEAKKAEVKLKYICS